MFKDFKRDDALKYMINNPGECLYDVYGLPWMYDNDKNVICWTFSINDEIFTDEIDISDFKIKFTRSVEFSLIIPNID